jgi:hypothetical protein
VRDWAAFVCEQLRLPDLPPERESRIVRELAAQLEDFYREALAAGSSEAEADAHACGQIRDWDRMAQDVWLADRRHARPRIERLTNTIETMAGRKPGGLQMLADVLRDARYAVRQLTKSPGFAVVAILTMALGIGATSAMFSVINGVLLRPLPFPDSDALVRVNEIVPQYGRFSVAPASFLDWRRRTRPSNGSWRSRRATPRSTAPTVRAHPQRCRFVGFLRDAPHAADPRTHVQGRGGHAWQERRDRAEPRNVAAPVRRRPERCRPGDYPQRRAGHDYRRDAGRFCLSGGRGAQYRSASTRQRLRAAGISSRSSPA